MSLLATGVPGVLVKQSKYLSIEIWVSSVEFYSIQIGIRVLLIPFPPQLPGVDRNVLRSVYFLRMRSLYASYGTW